MSIESPHAPTTEAQRIQFDPDQHVFEQRVRQWLAKRLPTREATVREGYAIFHDRSADEESRLIDRAREWQRQKFDAGIGALGLDDAFGGVPDAGPAHVRTLAAIEHEFATPDRHELLEVTVGMVAPTLIRHGSAPQRERFVRSMLRTDETCCQLFSEPGAGSDLAAVATRAVRHGDVWRINGQKVWTSGARYADWGFLLARTDTTVTKHRGITAFLVPMSAPGVEVRPIRQMSGGSSFNEVFLTDVSISDDLRIGDAGSGWGIGLDLLGHERAVSGASTDIGGDMSDLVRLVRQTGYHDQRVTERIGQTWTQLHATAAYGRLLAERDALGLPVSGADHSVAKLAWSDNLTMIGDVAAEIAGAAMAADVGQHDHYRWTEHLLGAPGFHIAGGSDEIQRNIIGERGLGLPREAARGAGSKGGR